MAIPILETARLLLRPHRLDDLEGCVWIEPVSVAPRCLISTGMRCFLLPDLTQHIGMNVEPDVRHVIEMLACDKPDDFTYLAFGIESSQLRENPGFYPFVPGQFGRVLQRGAFRICEKRACPVIPERIEFGLIHRGFDREIPADINAEQANIGARHLFPD